MVLLFPFLIYSLLYRPTVFCILKQVDYLILKIFSEFAFIEIFSISAIMFLIFMSVVYVLGGSILTVPFTQHSVLVLWMYYLSLFLQ